MAAVSVRSDRPQRPRYMLCRDAVIDAATVPVPRVQLPDPGTLKVTPASGCGILPSLNWRGVNISKTSPMPSNMKFSLKEGASKTDAVWASTRWMACSCAWRRSQKPALRGGGPKVQHSFSGSILAIVSRNEFDPSRNHPDAPTEGAGGSSTNFPLRTISAAHRSIEPRCPKSPSSVQPGQAGTECASFSAGCLARTRS